MAKKKEFQPEAEEVSVEGINELVVDFQREDLNLLRDKVNELVRWTK